MNQFNNLMKQAQQMQAKLAEAQSKLATMEFEGSSGGGMVKLIINGSGALLRVDIESSLLNPSEGETISYLLVAAYSDAKAKMEEAASSAMSLDGMLPPGFKLPF